MLWCCYVVPLLFFCGVVGVFGLVEGFVVWFDVLWRMDEVMDVLIGD